LKNILKDRQKDRQDMIPKRRSDMSKDIIEEMVQNFLSWKLPENFNPDAGITFNPEYNVEYMASQGKPPMRHEPTGTNLFDADQAREMIEFMITGSNRLTQNRKSIEAVKNLRNSLAYKGGSDERV